MENLKKEVLEDLRTQTESNPSTVWSKLDLINLEQMRGQEKFKMELLVKMAAILRSGDSKNPIGLLAGVIDGEIKKHVIAQETSWGTVKQLEQVEKLSKLGLTAEQFDFVKEKVVGRGRHARPEEKGAEEKKGPNLRSKVKQEPKD